MIFQKILSKIDDHVECIRYLWPDKRVSVLFKVLNFFSCDRLRSSVAFALVSVKDIKYFVDKMSKWNSDKALTKEEIDRCVNQLQRRCDKAIRWTEDIFGT